MAIPIPAISCNMLVPIIFVLIHTVLATSQLPLKQPHGEVAHSVYRSDLSSVHSIRIKSQGSTLCDTPVKQYTGWLDNGNKHLFFWYFEQEDTASQTYNGKNDLPLTLWLNGGPGASSMLGMLQELGPCLINKYANGTVYNPYGWNKDSAILFVEQPVGVGFSYYDGDESDRPTDSFASARDMDIFLRTFTHKVFPKHAKGPLVLAGESYGVS